MKAINSTLILLLLFSASAVWADGDYAPGEILVKFRSSGERAAMAGLSTRGPVSIQSRNAATGVYKLKIPKSASVEEMVRQYRGRSDVEWAEPNFRMHMATVPDDPDYESEQKWYYDLLSAERGWDHERGDPSVILAILDSGVDLDHPDLIGKIWINEDEIPGNNSDDDGNGRDDDVHGWDFVDEDSNPDVFAGDPAAGIFGESNKGVSHGTMVAGIAAAVSNNAAGVTGMAWECTIMPVRVLDAEGSGWTWDIAKAIVYAAENGARVINLSLGEDEYSATVAAAVGKAHDIYGCIIVAAAGNENELSALYPARFPEVIAVGASDDRDPDGRASFSNWGPDLDAVAPGVNIRSTSVTAISGTATYRTGNGTSFSSPLVAGLCGLILSRYPYYTNQQVRDLLKTTATDLPDDPDDSPNAGPDWDGAGMVNAYQVLRPLGDVTGNDEVAPLDASMILRHAVGLAVLVEGDSVAADVSGEAGVTPYDAALVLQYVVGHRTVFPAEEGGAFRIASAEERTIRVGALERMEDGRLRATIFADVRDGIVAGEMELRIEDNMVRVVSAAPGALPPEYLWTANATGDRLHLAFAGAEPLEGEDPLAQVILEPIPPSCEGLYLDVKESLHIERVRLNEGRIPTRPSSSPVARADRSEDASDRALELPSYMLYPNRPNPFNASTQIEYQTPTPGHIQLTVYDILGRRIETLVDEWRPAGRHAVRWGAGDASSGMYLCRLHVDGEDAQVRRMLLVR